MLLSEEPSSHSQSAELWLSSRRETYGTVQSLYSHIPCEVCENFGHSGNDCLETYEDALIDNNGFRPIGGLGWNQSHPQHQEGNYACNSNFANQPSLIEFMLGQAKINEDQTKKLASNDKILENINSKLEGLTFSFKNQLSLNKMFETQLAQLLLQFLHMILKKILGQPKVFILKMSIW